jgi:hypothetical protein
MIVTSAGASQRSGIKRTCASWRRTLRHGNVVVCIFFLLFFGSTRGRGLWHGNIVVGVLCVDTISYSGVYQNDQRPTFFFLGWSACRDCTLRRLTVFWLSPRTKNELALLWVLFDIFLLLRYDIFEFCFEVFELLLVRVRE